MKTYFLLFSLILFPFVNSFTQSPDIQWGSSFSNENYIFEIVGENSNGVYTVAQNDLGYVLKCFDKQSLKKHSSQEITVKQENGTDTYLGKIFMSGDNLRMLTYSFDSEKRELRLYGYFLDKEGKISSERTDLLIWPLAEKTNLSLREVIVQDIRVSPDGSKLLVSNSYYTNNTFHLEMFLYSSDFEQIQRVKKSIDIDEYGMITWDEFEVDNQGRIYIPIIYSELKRVPALQNIIESWDVYSFRPENGFKEEKIPIRLGDFTARSLKISLDKEQDLVIAGLYGKKGESMAQTGSVGSFFMKIDPQNNHVIHSSSEAFSKDFMKQVPVIKYVGNTSISTSFLAQHIFHKPDGGSVFVAEYNNLTSTKGSLIFVEINAVGNITGTYTIAKKQEGDSGEFFQLMKGFIPFSWEIGINYIYAPVGTGFSFMYHSALMGFVDGKIYSIYNDHSKNITGNDYRKVKPLRDYRKSVPVLAEINGNGSVKKSMLEGENQKISFRILSAYQVSEKEVLVIGEHPDGDRLGRIIFN